LLLLGLLTRLGAFFALLLSVAFTLATFHLVDGRLAVGLGAVSLGFVVMALAVIIAAAGRTWGFDAAIAKRSKTKILW